MIQTVHVTVNPVVDETTQEGFAVDGYHLELWYYGHAVMHVVNGRVWGRSLYTSAPVRVHWAPR